VHVNDWPGGDRKRETCPQFLVKLRNSCPNPPPITRARPEEETTTDWRTYRNGNRGSLGIWKGWCDIAPQSLAIAYTDHVAAKVLTTLEAHAHQQGEL
jgi:hypothetical protein